MSAVSAVECYANKSLFMPCSLCLDIKNLFGVPLFILICHASVVCARKGTRLLVYLETCAPRLISHVCRDLDRDSPVWAFPEHREHRASREVSIRLISLSLSINLRSVCINLNDCTSIMSFMHPHVTGMATTHASQRRVPTLLGFWHAWDYTNQYHQFKADQRVFVCALFSEWQGWPERKVGHGWTDG
jgi:hypothetical protein